MGFQAVLFALPRTAIANPPGGRRSEWVTKPVVGMESFVGRLILKGHPKSALLRLSG